MCITMIDDADPIAGDEAEDWFAYAKHKRAEEKKQDPNVDGLQGRAVKLREWDRCLRKQVTQRVRFAIRLINVRDRTLVLETSTPAQAAMLRLETLEILRAAGACGIGANRVLVKVGRNEWSPPAEPVTSKPISDARRQEIVAIADRIDDAELSAALKRLAQSGVGKS